jgi:hypothetical protein
MGVGEIPASPCQCIHVRRSRFRMASKESDPVVEIVDADHQNVGFVRLFGSSASCSKLKRQRDNHYE